MPQDALPNGGAPGPAEGPWPRVAGIQAKLHRWAAADTGRRNDDLFNLVHDPATLQVAFARVAGNKGAGTPGIDGGPGPRSIWPCAGRWASSWRAGGCG